VGGVPLNACRALASLSVPPENGVAIAEAGGIPLLVALLTPPSALEAQFAAETLRNMSANVESRVKIASVGGIPPLIALLASSSADAQEHAAGALSNLSVSVENKKNTNTNTKYTCDTGQTRNKLLAQWVHLTNHAAGHENMVVITAAGGIPHFVALLASPSVLVQRSLLRAHSAT
jgi:vacuolar protein 8